MKWIVDFWRDLRFDLSTYFRKASQKECERTKTERADGSEELDYDDWVLAAEAQKLTSLTDSQTVSIPIQHHDVIEFMEENKGGSWNWHNRLLVSQVKQLCLVLKTPGEEVRRRLLHPVCFCNNLRTWRVKSAVDQQTKTTGSERRYENGQMRVLYKFYSTCGPKLELLNYDRLADHAIYVFHFF